MKRIFLILTCNLLLSGAVAFAADDDGDGIDSAVETVIGTDPMDPDTDNDGLLDGQEDLDQDGILDINETNAKDADTDDDGIKDGDEPVFLLNNRVYDSDADGLNDGQEIGRTTGIFGGTSDFAGIPYTGTAGTWTGDANPATKTDPLDADSDDDLMSDGSEDKDHDGLVDANEPNPADADTDDDGLKDGEEDLDDDCTVDAGETNPLISDSDGDFLTDGLEKGRTSPIAAGSSEGGSVSNRVPYMGTSGGWVPDSDPLTTTIATDNDTDNDGLTDGVEDTDHDGFVDATETDPNNDDTDGDLSHDNIDCKPLDPSVYPGATEIPADGIDQDCNGGDLCYKDADNDGWRPDASSTVVSADCDCLDPGEATSTDPTGDCNDALSYVYPGATEIPGDGIDENCDGMELCYKDADDDGYRPDATSTVLSVDCDCSNPGEATDANPIGDCNDNDGSVYPEATEIPGDGIDENCDGIELCYKDADDDGYRPDATSTIASADCDCSDAFEATSADPTGDCNDALGYVYPGAPEIPGDGIDENCDGMELCYKDADDDGYRPDAISTVNSMDCDCTDPFEATTSDPTTDCNDNNAFVHPGATEYCDGLDNGCWGSVPLNEIDHDGDGYIECFPYVNHGAPFISGGGDCDDGTASVFPGNPEICDGRDNDCNSFIDDGVLITFYRDLDGDTYGDPTNTIQACSAPIGYVANGIDCDDNDGSRNPGATEIPGDGIDQNCDTDELCFVDADNDGYRPDATSTVLSADCDCADSYEAVSTDPTDDCNDNDDSIFPGAPEIPDDYIDQDCNGIDAITCYVDNDQDGYGTGIGTTVIALDGVCNTSQSESVYDTDCNDNNISYHPNASEVCDDPDFNCDGFTYNSSSGSITVTACNSYTAPDGAVYTTSGIKTAVIANAAGCDSTITIDLTVTNNTTSSISETACDSYTAPDGFVYTASGIVTAIIPNAAGCDSTITIDLTVKNSTTSSISETVCYSYTAPDGSVYTSSGIVTAVIPNAAGCDSTITIDLTVNNNTTSSLSETACDSYTAPDGLVYTSSGIITAVIPNAAGCDSTITIDLTVNNSSSNSITETACNSYTAPDGSVYTASGIITAVIPNTAGCDSLITIDLTMILINVSVIQSSNVLTAITSPATYQWLDCDNNYNSLASEINQSFVATASGNYAVEITQNSCADTSICYNVTIINITESTFDSKIYVYPNPTTGIVYVDMGTIMPETRLSIKDIVGRVVKESVYNNMQLLEVKLDEPVGVYFITITSESKEAVVRIIKE